MDDLLTGRRIVEVRPQTQAEKDEEGWLHPATVLVLDDGTKLYPSMDDEGNGAGTLFGMTTTGDAFALA